MKTKFKFILNIGLFGFYSNFIEIKRNGKIDVEHHIHILLPFSTIEITKKININK